MMASVCQMLCNIQRTRPNQIKSDILGDKTMLGDFALLIRPCRISSYVCGIDDYELCLFMPLHYQYSLLLYHLSRQSL